MSDESFLRLSRRFFSNPLWEEPRAYSRAEAWLDCLRTAAWEEHRRVITGSMIEIPRGGFVASVRYLSDRWQWSKTKVCAFLDLLESEKMITRQKGQQITVVCLCKYDQYNPKAALKKDTERTPERHPKDDIEEDIEEEVKEKRRGSQPKSVEEIKAHALVYPSLPKPDAAFCDWFWDEGEKRGWTDPKSGLPWHDWKAAFRSAWRGAVHNKQERDSRRGAPQPNLPPKPVRTQV